MATSGLTGPRPGLPDSTLARLQQHIANHLGERLDLEGLARVACLSRFHFARRFRQSTGCSPMAYVQRARLLAACQWLDQQGGRVSDIAAMLGYFDQSHFTRAFRRATGMTPGQYLRRPRGSTDG